MVWFSKISHLVLEGEGGVRTFLIRILPATLPASRARGVKSFDKCVENFFFRFQLLKFLWVGHLGAEEETQEEEGEKETVQVSVQVRELVSNFHKN